MSEEYSRTATIRAEETTLTDGMISGTLATNGEASDGHILDVRGIELPDGKVPLLFGHDAFSGRNNLGSWVNFAVRGNQRQSLGGDQLHGVAQIELGGEGEQKAFRNDVAHMVAQGHVQDFSVRWAPIGDVVPRSDLEKDHWAKPAEDSPEAARHGMFFGKSRILEGSIVSIGSDPKAKAAVIGRAMQSAARSLWIPLLGEDVVMNLLERIESLEEHRRAIPFQPMELRRESQELAEEKVVPGDETPEAGTEDSAPSTALEPESRPEETERLDIDELMTGLDTLLGNYGSRLDAAAEGLKEKFLG